MKEGMRIRVREGIILLDREGPPAWRGMVDGDALEMVNSRRCVLGQIYTSSVIGVDVLFAGDGTMMGPYGFNLDNDDLEEWRAIFVADPYAQPDWNPFDRLREVWLEELAAVS